MAAKDNSNTQMNLFGEDEPVKKTKKKKTAPDDSAPAKGVTKRLSLKDDKPAKEEKKPVLVKRKTVQRKTVNAGHISDDQIEAKAKSMGDKQRDIAVSEFFAKNRHLLGFDNPSKALLTTIKEAVDNSLDACEEAHILPEIIVEIQQRSENRFRVAIQDNGPGIVKNQIPNIFGRLLYGSKFHSLRMSRGQQGIGISAAGMYGMLTTGKNVCITSKTGPKAQAFYCELRIDTRINRPEIIDDKPVDWDVKSGTRVEIEMEARYQRGRQSVDEYLAQTAIANPHVKITYKMPDGVEHVYNRAVETVVHVPEPVKPHPYGVELGILMKMCQDTNAKTVREFLCNEFSRVSSKLATEILSKAKISVNAKPITIDHELADRLYKSINDTKIMAPSTNCVVPIGEAELLKGLQEVVDAEFYTVCTRPASVYRGNPFQIEAALAYGGRGYATAGVIANSSNKKEEDDNQDLMRILRFANRVPLLYQQSACAVTKSIIQTNWRLYGLSQSRGSLPVGPITIIVHIASVWVPFTSESKEAVAHYPEIIKEIKLALSECGRRLGSYMRGQKKAKEEAKKRDYIKKYLPAIGEAIRDILALPDDKVDIMLDNMKIVLEASRAKGSKNTDDDDDNDDTNPDEIINSANDDANEYDDDSSNDE
ncbi:MAG: DNA topoisomerase VI subunit B [Sedimentisphaerales bacterium]|nr:DNA topoisomerase VI subunit B [Sedimentisphaerales bacterium]